MPAFRSHSTPTTDAAWDAGANEKRVRVDEKRSYYSRIYGWYDPDGDEGAKSTYKFIHHMVDGDGAPGDANETACSTGIGVLNGGRGGTNIPKADRQGVYDHLARHLRDAGKEPPELKGQFEETRESAMRSELHMRAAAEVWAILPVWLTAALGRPARPHVAQDALMAITRPGPRTGRMVRVKIVGPITKRDSFWAMLFGGASVEGISTTLRELAADDSVGGVLLDIDSPGGTADGLSELAGEVRKLAQSKRVTALANGMMASAAYWIGSQADEIVATPDALVGSVGVFVVHDDISGRLEMMGVKPTYVFAGKYKTEFNSDEPLTDEARSHLQEIVDETYDLFVADVAQGRKVTAAQVRSEYGEGRLLTASAARAAGLIDRVAGVDETIRRLIGAKAEGAIDSPQAREGEDGLARLAHFRRRLDIAQNS